MEFFRQTSINWMGKSKFFFALSGFLLLVGLTAIIRNGGLTYSIDFKGGTLVTVRFAQPPNQDAIRHQLPQSTIQSIHDVTNPNANDIVIGLEEQGRGDQAIDAGKTTIINALSQSFPAGEPGKQDFNSESITTKAIADYLVSKDPLSLGLAA